MKYYIKSIDIQIETYTISTEIVRITLQLKATYNNSITISELYKINDPKIIWYQDKFRNQEPVELTIN